MKKKAAGFTVLVCASLTGQVQGPVPPPRVNPDLSVTYFVNMEAKNVQLIDSVFSLSPPFLIFAL